MGMIYSPGVAGSTGQVQFNNSGVIGADSSLSWNPSSKILQTSNISLTPQANNFSTNNISLESVHFRQQPHGIGLQVKEDSSVAPIMRYSQGRVGFGSGNVSPGLTSAKIEFRGNELYMDCLSPIVFGENNAGNNNLLTVLHDSSTANNDTFYFSTTKVANSSFRPSLLFSGFTTTFQAGLSSVPVLSLTSTGSIFTTSSGSNPVLVARGFVSHSSNIQEWQNSSGVTRASVTKDFELQTTTGSGAPTTTPADGATYVDTTNHRLYVRSGGSWKYTNLI